MYWTRAALVALVVIGTFTVQQAFSDGRADTPIEEQSGFVVRSEEQKLRDQLRSRLLSLTEQYVEIAPVEQLEKEIAAIAMKVEQVKAERALAAACEQLARVAKNHPGTDAAQVAERMLGQQNQKTFGGIVPVRNPDKKIVNGIERSAAPKFEGHKRF